MSVEARAAAETAARDSYGRLLAYLASRWRDLAAAEDALAEAFRVALEHWPVVGVPDHPDAWLLTVARRHLLHGARHARVRSDPAAAVLFDDMIEPDESGEARFPDDRLKLLFVCAHPAVDAAARTPLMLQTVLGFDAARIASAFLVSPTAMSQRLVRAKSRIRDAGIRFEVPEPGELSDRLETVLEAIYASYGSGWEDVVGADPRRVGLTDAAIELGRITAGLLPNEPEPLGLLSLMLFCESRREARRDAQGRFVPLDRQDAGLWSRPMIRAAERALDSASRLGRLGPFQLEAAIQSAHAQRAVDGVTPWAAIASLYEGRLRLRPSLGAAIAHAAAIGEARGPEAGLTLLDQLPAERIRGYQPYWALRAHLLSGVPQPVESRAAYELAIGLAEDPSVRAFLIERRDRVCSASTRL